MKKYLIVGLGIAGLTAAKTIRSLDPEGEISIYTDEQTLFYPKPKLFDLIYETFSAKDIYYYDSFWYDTNRIRLHLGTGIRKIDAIEHKLLTEDGGTVNYDSLLIANGASCFVPSFEGTYTPGVFTLRNLSDAFAIRRHSRLIGNHKPVVVIGGGVLGLEAAHSFMKNKLRPTVIEHNSYLLPRQIDKEGADVLKGIFENWGIEIKTDSSTERITGEKNVDKVILSNGTMLPAEMVLISSGVRSNVDLLERSNLPYKKGALVDDNLTVTEDVYAAGDIAEHNGNVYGIIPPAIEQATIAAKNMIKPGTATYHGSVPTNTLKIAGFDFTSIGLVNLIEDDPQYEIIRAKAPIDGKYRKIVLKDGTVQGIIILGLKGEAIAANKLVNTHADVSQYKERLKDIAFSLKETRT
jgi:nitrite reductase (NADH) large subunit